MKKSWKVRIAERILENQKIYEEQQKRKELNYDILLKAKREVHSKKFQGFREKYLNDMVETFKQSTRPAFKNNTQAVLNWYARPNSWEGDIRHNLSFNGEVGPAYVIIEKTWVDVSYMSECIDEWDSKGNFGENGFIDELYTYEKFAEKVNKLRMNTQYPVLPWIGWECSFRFLDPKYKKPKWGLRETNFIDINDEESRIAKELWDYEQSIKEAKEKVEEFEKKMKDYHEKMRLIAHQSSKFYVSSFY